MPLEDFARLVGVDLLVYPSLVPLVTQLDVAALPAPWTLVASDSDDAESLLYFNSATNVCTPDRPGLAAAKAQVAAAVAAVDATPRRVDEMTCSAAAVPPLAWKCLHTGDICCGPGSKYLHDPTITQRFENVTTLAAARSFVDGDSDIANPIVMWQLTNPWGRTKPQHLVLHRRKFLAQNLDANTGQPISAFARGVSNFAKGKRWGSPMFYTDAPGTPKSMVAPTSCNDRTVSPDGIVVGNVACVPLPQPSAAATAPRAAPGPTISQPRVVPPSSIDAHEAEVFDLRRQLSAALKGAAAESAAREVSGCPDEFVCPITGEVMVDPVVTADGFTYERVAIAKWLKTHQTSPCTNAVLEHRHLATNLALRSQIRDHVARTEGK
jgi:hypothetical protein